MVAVALDGVAAAGWLVLFLLGFPARLPWFSLVMAGVMAVGGIVLASMLRRPGGGRS